MTRQDEIRKAEEAKQLLRHPLLTSALEDIKSGLIEAWRQSPVKDTDLREHLWAVYAGACKFEELLKSHVDTGKLAAEQLRMSGDRHPSQNGVV